MQDFTSDPNPRGLYALEKAGHAMPSFLQDCEWPGAADVAGLASTAFADPSRRLHPVHNKAACMLTAMYLYGLPEVSEHVLVNTKRAAAVHGIESEVLPLLEPLSNTNAVQTKAAADGFALHAGDQNFYPVRTRYEVEQSGVGLLHDFKGGLLPVKEARQAALCLVKRATDVGANLPDDIRRLGTPTVLSPAAVTTQANWRSKEARGTDNGLYKAALDTYLSDISEDTRQACAQAWADLDDMLGVKTSAYIPSVTSVWFDGLSESVVKAAAQQTLWIGEDVLPSAVLTSIPGEVLASWYAGDEAVKMAAIHTTAKVDTFRASEMLEELGKDNLAVLAAHLTAYHNP